MRVDGDGRGETDRALSAEPGNEEAFARFAAIARRLADDPTFYSRIKANIKGVTEVKNDMRVK